MAFRLWNPSNLRAFPKRGQRRLTETHRTDAGVLPDPGQASKAPPRASDCSQGEAHLEADPGAAGGTKAGLAGPLGLLPPSPELETTDRKWGNGGLVPHQDMAQGPGAWTLCLLGLRILPLLLPGGPGHHVAFLLISTSKPSHLHPQPPWQSSI